MAWAFSLSTLWAVLAGLLVLLIVHVSRPRWRARLAPGPKPFPIIGNVLDMPSGHLGRGFMDLSAKYGTIMYMCVFGQPIVVVSSYQAARELLDKRSAIYSDRIPTIMGELSGFDLLLAMKPYGPEWRTQRRAFHQVFNSQRSSQYYPVQLAGTRGFLLAVLESPSDVVKKLKFAFDASILQITYGIKPSDSDDKYHAMIEHAMEAGEDVLTLGRYAVEVFPFLRYLPSWCPGGRFQKYTAQVKEEVTEIVNTLFETAKQQMYTDVGRGSILSSLLNEGKDLSPAEIADLENLCKDVGFSGYTGSDTTNTTLFAFLLAMALYPDVQQKAQEELDTVIGQSRLPDFSDRDSLPYINALVKELYRWHVVAPIGVPHLSTSDDEYNGYLIPAGSLICPNLWAMSRDKKYTDPERFMPERFLDSSGKLDISEGDPEDFAFGFGRRRCPGRHFADSSIFILCASVLYSFKVQGPLDELGIPVKMEHTFGSTGVISHSEVYDYVLTPRSPRVEDLIRSLTPTGNTAP